MKTISRQLRYQREHKEKGLCRLCCHRLDPDSIVFCTVHRERVRQQLGNIEVRGKARWLKVDWSRDNLDIARKLGVTEPSVKRQREKLRPGKT